MTTPILAVVVSPRPWAQELHRFTADHGGAHVRLRVVDAREAEHEPYNVLVVEDLTSFLTARLVDRLHQQGKRVLGVHDPAEPRGGAHLGELGVDEVATTDRPPSDLVALAAVLAAGRQLVAQVDAGRSTPTGPLPAPAEPAATQRAHVLAVGGPAGAPGASEVAIALAVVAARRGERVVLVDGDEVAPALAQRLGLAPHPNLRSAIDASQNLQSHVGTQVQDVADVPGLTLLGGLPNVAAWADARPGEVVALVEDLAADVDRVVVNVGPRLDELGERRRGHGRHAQTRALLELADDLVAVGLPTPVGVARLLDWIATARTITSGAIDVAINRCPKRGFVAGEVADEVQRSWTPATLALLPDDAKLARAAWRGTVDGSRSWWGAVQDLADGVLRDPVPLAPPAPVDTAVDGAPALVGGGA